MDNQDQRAEDLFAAARKMAEAAARRAYLDGACAGDAALRQEVESLLQAHFAAGDFLGKTMMLPPADVANERPGSKIGRYKLLEKIGEGGFGVVWMAEQEEPVRRRVALKIIKPGMDTKEVVARFEAERQALAMMDHPNIASVFDGGTTDTGRPYFVMELVKGIPITEFCDANKLSTANRLGLFIQVCHAVQHAHQKGVIHRDLKPTNILVTVKDDQPLPKVIDFGVAKATQLRLTDKTVFTRLNLCVGTPAYMSPEQAGLGSLDVDTRSDVYSLGVLLYELITGCTPFDNKKLLAAGLDAVMRFIREEEPPKPSTRLSALKDEELTVVAAQRQVDPARLNRLVRGDLDWIVLKALEKDRKRRYETPNALAQDIGHFLHAEPVNAAAPDVFYLCGKFIRRHKLGLGVFAAIGLLLVAGIAASTFEALRAQRNAVEARTQAARASELAQRELRQREKAEQIADQNRRNLYAARINLAEQCFEQGDITRLTELLESLHPGADEEDLRGFEWYYLRRLAHAEQLVLKGGGSRLRAVAFSPDGGLLATAGEDGLARLWDAANGNSLAILGETNRLLKALAFSPDGKTLATGGQGGVIRLWDVATHTMRAALAKLTNDVGALAFSPDGRWLAGSSAILFMPRGNPATRYVSLDSFPAMVKVWDVVALTEVASFKAHDAGILSLAFSTNGDLLATASVDQKVKLWEIPSGNLRRSFAGVDEYAMSVAISPDGMLLAAGGGDPWQQQAMLKLWDIKTGSELRSLRGSRGPVLALAFAPDGRTLASAGLDRVVRRWDVHSGNQWASTKGHADVIWSVAYDSTGRRFVTASADGTAKVWDALASQDFETITNGEGYNLAFSPDGKRLVASGRRVQLIEMDTNRAMATLPEYLDNDTTSVFSPDGKVLATTGQDGVVALWDSISRRKAGTLEGDGAKIWCLAFSPDGKTLAAGSEGTNSNLRLWDIASQREIVAIRPFPVTVRSFAFTPDRQSLLAGSWNSLVCLNPVTGAEKWRIPGAAPFLAVTPDGRWLAAVGIGAKRVRLIDLQTKTVRWSIQAHNDTIYSLAISPDGKTLATSSWDGTAKLWNVATGEELFSFKAPAVVWCTAFSPDGMWWAVGSGSARKSQIALFRRATEAEVISDKLRSP